MTDNLPPLPAGFVPADEQTQTPSGLPPLPAGFEPADNQSTQTANPTPPSPQQFKTGDMQQKPGAPIVNASNVPAPETEFYKKHPANVLYRDIRSTQTPEQVAGRQQTAAAVQQRIEQPVTTNDVMSQEYQKNHPIQAGLTDLATGMLTPKNIAIMAATEGLGTLAGPESVAASKVARALSAYFTTDQIHGIMKESPEAWKAFKEGDEATALRLATHIIGGAGFATLSAQHAAGVEATPSTRFGEKADQFVDNASNRVKQAFRSDQTAMQVANARHQSAMVEHAQRQREADIAPAQAIEARQKAEQLNAAYEQGQPLPVDRNGSALHKSLASYFGEIWQGTDYSELENRLQAETLEKQKSLQPLSADENALLDEIQKQNQADAQRPPVTKKQVDDQNTLASKAAANARKATQALVDSHEALNTTAAEVDRMSRNIEETQSGMSSVTKTVLKKLGLGGLNAEESMVKAGRPNVNSDQKFREALKTAAPALVHATEGVKVKTVGQFEDLLHDTANDIRNKVFNPMIQEHAGETIEGQSIGDNIRSAITDQMREYAPEDVEELEDFASKFNKNMTLKKAESDLQYFNAELKKFYRMNAVDQSAALKTSGTVAKYEAAADGLRDAIHSKLNELGETGHEDAQLQYGALKDLERTFAKRATVADRQAPISLHQILTYAGGLGEAAAMFLHSPLTAVAAAVPIGVSIAAKHINSPEYQIRNGLKQMRAEMDARETVPPPPSREFSPLHSELATTYGEDVRDTSYQELESRLAEDIKAIRAKMRRGVLLDTVENNKLAQYGQINAQNAADQIKSQKDADKLDEEKQKLPQPNLPIGAQSPLELPSAKLDPKFNTQKAIVHDMAHHIVGDAMGIDFIDGIRSHEHPTNQNSGALMSAPIDWSPFLDGSGKVDPAKLKSKINAIVATYVAGGVANDLYHGISFDENPHLGADMDILKNFLGKRGFNEAEISRTIAQGVDDAAKILSQPGVQDILEQHASVREPGLSNKYQVSPKRMEQIKNDLRGGYANEPTTGKSGAVSGEGKQRPSGNAAGGEGNIEAGATGKVQQAGETKAAKEAEDTGAEQPAGNTDIIGKTPDEFASIKRPKQGWGNSEGTPSAPEFATNPVNDERIEGPGWLLNDGTYKPLKGRRTHTETLLNDETGKLSYKDADAAMKDGHVRVLNFDKQGGRIGFDGFDSPKSRKVISDAIKKNPQTYAVDLSFRNPSVDISNANPDFVRKWLDSGSKEPPTRGLGYNVWGEKTPGSPEFATIRNETALPHKYTFYVQDKNGNETSHVVEGLSKQQAMDELHDTLEPGSWSQIRSSKEAPQRTPNTNYEIPKNKIQKMRDSNVLTGPEHAQKVIRKPEQSTIEHELGHVITGHLNKIPYESIISHRHPLLEDQPRSRAAAVADLSQFKNQRGSFDRDSFGNGGLPRLMESLMGGIAADELFAGEDRSKTMSRTGSGDVAAAWSLGKNLGLTSGETETIINNAIDSAKQKLSHPVTSGIIKENSPFRESNLSKAYHYSEERLNNMRAEHDRRMREYEQANSGTNLGAAEQGLGAGNSGEQNRASGPAQGAVPTVAPAGASTRVPEQAAQVSGLRETSTGDPQADAAIKKAGAIPAGVMFPGQDYELKAFHDPQTGSTLNFRKNEPVTPETVKAKLDESRKAFGVTNETAIKNPADMKRAELKTELGITGDDPRNGLSNKTLQKQLEKHRGEAPESPKFGKIAEAANKFNEERDRKPIVPGTTHSPEVAKKIADAYDQMKHDPNSPAVKKSYDAMKKDIDDQWNYARDKMGIKFEPWDKSGQPYQNSKQMVDDVKNNSHLSFFRGGDMPADHPLAETDPETGLTYNDKLRAIHDLFGHAANDNQFGPKGEENAWNEHRQMFSPEALPAVTSETRGQNSWVNFGKHLRNEAGNIPAKGEPGYVPASERPFAEQKAGILPAEFYQPNPTGQYHPELQKIADRFGTHNSPAKAAAPGASFVAPDGKFITLPGGITHDSAIDFNQGSLHGNGDNRVPFINNTGAIRIRSSVDRSGNNLHISVPDNVTPAQIDSLKSTVAANGRYGNVALERANITPDTKDDRSTFKEFARPSDVESMLQQIGTKTPGTELPASPKLGPRGSSVPLMKNPLKIKGTAENDRVNTLDVAKALNEFTNKKIGSLELGKADPQQMVERAKKLAEDEAKYQRAQANSGEAWYTTDIGTHDGVLKNLRPELADPAKLSIFKMAEAVLSSGQKPYGNLKSAIKAWDHYNETGEFPPTNPDTGNSWGPRSTAGYGNALQMINRLVKEKGEQGASDWLLSDHTVNELRDYNKNVSGKQDDSQLGAMILGPKRGPFAQNLHGIESAFTADMWVSRTWNRWMGTLDTNPGPDGNQATDSPKNLQERRLMERSFSETADKLGISTSALQAVLWYYEQGLYDVHGAKKESWSFADAAKRVEKEHNEAKDTGFDFGANEGKGQDESKLDPRVQGILALMRSTRK